MYLIKKYKKLFLAILFIITLFLGTKVQAFEYTFQAKNTRIGTFKPYAADPSGEWIFYCIQHYNPYKATLPDGYNENQTYGEEWCEECGEEPSELPNDFNTTKNSMTYKWTSTIDERYYQDAAYVIASAAEAGEEAITYQTTQYSIWNTAVNIGGLDNNKGEWGEEAVAYKTFYNNIHNGTNDIYSTKLYDKTNVNEVRVKVNQTNNEYIVGPFIIEYPNGDYGTKKWSYITNITLLDQAGNGIGDVVNNSIHIIDSSGNELRDTINNNNFPNSNDNFYVKFLSTLGNGDICNIKLKVDFKYLESCSATLQEYNGKLFTWVWKAVYSENQCDNGHQKKTWKLTVTEGGTPQRIMAYQKIQNEVFCSGEYRKNYKEASLIVTPNGIPLTMKISGQVFLDRDTGKINTGNNIMDGNNEALNGVEVVLLDAATNEVVTRSNTISQYHVHTDSCYEQQEAVILVTNPDHPYHIGSCESGGPGTCFENAVTHVHTGSPSGVIKPHVHTSKCYSDGHKHTDECLCGGQLFTPFGTHYIHECRACGNVIGNSVWGWDKITAVPGADCNDHYNGKCTNPTKCGKTEETGSGELICGYEEGQNELVGDGCYTIPVYHKHTGDSTTGGGCYGEKEEIKEEYWYCTIDRCCEGWGRATYLWCPHGHGNKFGIDTTKGIRTKESYSLNCGLNEGDIERFELNCGFDGEETVAWELTCTIPTIIEQTVSQKVLICDKSNQIDNTITTNLTNPVITDNNGYYEFDGLDPMKKYYVKFVYNGMLYTNVVYDELNTDKGSKADETSRFNFRTGLNNRFGEIRSYPNNYKITQNTSTSFEDSLLIDGEIGYNKVFLQEEIADIFKMISKEMVGKGVQNPEQTDPTNTNNDALWEVYNALKGEKDDKELEELKRKILFARHCRVSSYTVKNYPLTDKFTIGTNATTIGNVNYPPIYSGEYNQLHVNLGIKSRPTVDLALYKDVFKSEVSINGKTETYYYDARKQSPIFRIGITEKDYLNGLRGMYQNGREFTNNQKTRKIDVDSYNMEMRSEEIANGKSSEYNSNVTGKVDGNYKVSEDYNLTGDNRLKIKVTYKIAIRNQSSTTGAITELVDYYDTNYNFVDAYVGDANGNKTGDVTKYDNSMYAGTEYKSTKNAYKTIYLRPNNEKRLDNAEEQYIYVVLELVGPSGDVGTLLTKKLLTDNSTLKTMNLVEINGYKTYDSKESVNTPGLIDIDSNPGNFNISDITSLTQENIVNYPNISSMYEDDTNRAPLFVYKIHNSRSIEGTVFEDSTGNVGVATGKDRIGNGKIELDKGEKGIAGVVVELIEIKNNEMIVRATTKTNSNGWYGFTGFVAGDYVIRYTYGADNDTALATSSVYEKGLNEKSYNGQDYQATTFGIKADSSLTTNSYKTDASLIKRYTDNVSQKNTEEKVEQITSKSKLDRYASGYYWYAINDGLSDAKDDAYRRQQVIDYSNSEYGTKITNHKAEVFNAYVNPQPSHITADVNKTLVNELERRTYRYAYTPVMEIEVEYATKTTTGTTSHEHKITGVDFGLVERPKSELTLDQDVAHIKVTLADGTVLFDTETETNNLQWINNGDIKVYDKNELINIIMDEELISGAQLEVTYYLTVKNNSEKDIDTTTSAKNIINYVSNNLNFDEQDNLTNGKPLWKVVSKDSIQNDKKSTFVNNTVVDLSTQSVILQATQDNPLINTILKPGDQVTTTLKLKKVLAAENSNDDLTYTNMTEIVEIDNTVGRYDHGAIPGNQKLELQPQEHDASGASKKAIATVDPEHPQDGTIIVTPPTGSNYIYYVIGITSALILLAGTFLIKKFVIDKKK